MGIVAMRLRLKPYSHGYPKSLMMIVPNSLGLTLCTNSTIIQIMELSNAGLLRHLNISDNN